MEGIVVIEPLTPPVEIGPLGEYQYEFSVNLEGPPSINASYVWTIDGQNYTLELRGTRIVVLQANADWSSPVEETLSWATDVMIAVDGTEQRVGLNTNPRQVVKFDIKTDTAENTQYVMNQVYGWANRIFALPMWENESVLTVDHNIGDTTIQFDPAGWGHIEGGLIYLWGGDFHNYESVVIDSFGASNIVLSAPLTKKWGRGTRIAPIARGFLPRSTKLDYLTDGMVKGSFNFTVDSYQTSAVINTVAAPALLNGLEYYDEAPNWADILTHSFESDYVLLDRGYGRVVQEAINDYPVEVFRHSWLLGSRDEINLFKEFIKRREGRRVPVYIPTHKTDFVVVDATSVAVPLITVANSGYSTFIPVTSRRYGIRLEMVDGTVILRALLGMSKLDDNEVLTLDSGVGDYQPAQFRKVSLIKLCRLKSDSV
ncbi:MAG: hypothetical protein OEX12_13255, partial [Gammaproteobacteria bacterium]|nr:hypothetical protein [Gammaproteobacteria bacterium]